MNKHLNKILNIALTVYKDVPSRSKLADQMCSVRFLITF
jgi:hypothetical protein